MPNDIHVDCSSCSQYRRPQDGVSVLDWLSKGEHNFLCFTFELEGVIRISKTTYVFLELALDVRK
jgi:hypothetical protein